MTREDDILKDIGRTKRTILFVVRWLTAIAKGLATVIAFVTRKGKAKDTTHNGKL